MPNQLIAITLQSSDRAGIVSEIANVIHKHGGNWLDSQMVQMAGLFTGILTAMAPKNNLTALENDLQRLKVAGINTQLKVLEEELDNNSKQVPFELSGPDRSGIVSEFSQVFQQLNINIKSIQTRTESAAWSGEALFQANGTLLLSSDVDADIMLDRLNDIEDKLGIDITLSMDNAQ